MSQIIGGVEVTGVISPTDSTDQYAVIDPIYGIDGLRNVTGGTEVLITGNTTSISIARRRAGMIVGINNGLQYYSLNNQPWNGTINDWSLLDLTRKNCLSLSGGTVTGSTYFTDGLTANTISATTYLGVNTIYTSDGTLLNNRNINLSGNTLTFSGGNFYVGAATNPTLFNVSQGSTGIGTLGLNSGSTTVTGYLTQFTNTFKAGDSIAISDVATYTVASIASDTSLNLTTTYSGTGISGITIIGTTYSGSNNVTTSVISSLYFGVGDRVTISGSGFIQTFTITGNSSGTGLNSYNNGFGISLDSVFTGTSGIYNLINYNSRYNIPYTVNGGQRFSVNGNGNIAFGTNISGGSSTDMWYDAGNKALNIGSSISQSSYNLEVNGTSRTIGNVDFGVLTPPSNLTVTPISATGPNVLSADTTGTTFVYSVYAYGAFGNVTQPSNHVSVTVTGGTWNFLLSWNCDPNTNSFSVYRTTTNLVNSGDTNYNKLYNAIPSNYLYDGNYYNPINGTTPPSVSNTTVASRISYTGNSILLGGNLSVGASGNTLFSVNQRTVGIGTINVVSGSTTVTGNGTNFLDTFNPFDVIFINGSAYSISAITSNTLMSVLVWGDNDGTSFIPNTSYTGATANNINYSLNTQNGGGTKFSVKGNGVTTINEGSLNITTSVFGGPTWTGLNIDNGAFSVTTNSYLKNSTTVSNGVSNWNGSYLSYPNNSGDTRIALSSSGLKLTVPTGGPVVGIYPAYLSLLGSNANNSGLDNATSVPTTAGIIFNGSNTTNQINPNTQGIIQNTFNREISFWTPRNDNYQHLYPTNQATNLFETARFTGEGNFLIGSSSIIDNSLFSIRQNTFASGSVSLTSGSTTIIGHNTQFTNTFKIGDIITITAWTGTSSYTITAVNNDSSITVSTPYTGNGPNGLLITTGITINNGDTKIVGSVNVPLNSNINSSVSNNTTYNLYGPYLNTNDIIYISGTSSIDQYSISGFYDGIPNYGSYFIITPAFTGVTGEYNILSSNAYYLNYSLVGGQRFKVDGNGTTTINGKLNIISGTTGSSASIGSATFSSGVAVLTNTCITPNSKVFLTITSPSGSVGVPTRVSSSQTINYMEINSIITGTASIETGDNSTFDYWILN